VNAPAEAPVREAYAAHLSVGLDDVVAGAIDAVCIRLRYVGASKEAAELFRLDATDGRDRSFMGDELKWIAKNVRAARSPDVVRAIRHAFAVLREREAFSARLFALPARAS
jgi:hypothetical protein